MANTYQLTQTGAQVQADLDAVEAGDIVYLTTAPEAANTSGKLKIVVLETEPPTRYTGYIYIIKAPAPTGYTLTLMVSVGYFEGDIEYANGTTETIHHSYATQTYNNVVKIKTNFLIYTCGRGTTNVTFTPSSVGDNVDAAGGYFTTDYELTQDTTINNDNGTCLDGDTLVLTKNGYAKIKDINVDTELLTYNHQTGENEYKKVSRWWHHPSSDIVIVNDTIKMTGDHPIYRNDYEVVTARELEKGQYLINKDGGKIIINKLDYSNDTTEVYMIEVEDNHNFYITEDNILSHNY